MKLKWFKYLLVLVCLFAILERTGISFSMLFTKVYVHQIDIQQDTDEDATERNETKETNLKEFWAIHQQPELLSLITYLKAAAYLGETEEMHLAWITPVPTPPPNRLV